ncbi:MAG: four helix bundle protein [Gemmatimonadaceae bacterium]
MGDYRKLDVWKLACQFSDKVQDLARRLPPEERKWATEQLVPAARAIHENIAEGCGLNSDRQLNKFLRQALGTANECEDELLTLERRNLLSDADLELLADIRRICAMLAVFIRRVDESLAGQRPPRRRIAEPIADSRIAE